MPQVLFSQALQQRFPSFFDPCGSFAQHGVECDSAWNYLIEAFLIHCEGLQAPIKIRKIKFRFGRLRIHVSGADERVRSALDLIAIISAYGPRPAMQ